ncbi:type II toxin-antitoxin system VapC family toxin [Halanaeroarchaeum sulfurireducens]|nr:PIN domain-containing protein [Halanaeroarchaeum sulfurireducens]
MGVALLDTNVVFASASARDEYHDPASEIVHGIDHGDLPDAIVTDYVIAETLNLTRERLSPRAANQLLDRLIEGAHFEIVHTPKADFNAAQPIFRQHPALSFVDSTIVAFMGREEIVYLYSFDGDFDGIETLSRLDSAANPFD